MGDAVTPPPSRQNVCAVVVTYNPEPGLAGRLRPLLEQVGHAVVVDNASAEPAAAELAALGDRVTLQANASNVGLATALNQAVALAVARGAAWVMTLDDDSIVHPGMLAAYREALAQAPAGQRVAAVGANYWDLNRQRVGVHPYYRRFGVRQTTTLIQSGSLLSTQAYREAGPFRDDLFIDWIDFEYGLRLERAGFVSLQTSAVLLDHSLGKPVLHRFPVRKLCNHHSPARLYFWVRNRSVVLREYRGRVPRDLKDVAVGTFTTVRHILLHDTQRLRRLKAVALGLWHARTGRMGPAPASLVGGRHG